MTPLNILWIMADELRTDALSCYGSRDPRIQTPAIDALARQGTLFERCFTASPICVPARAAMATGRSPFASGIISNEAYDTPLPLDQTFPEILSDLGWESMNFGKEHLPGAVVPWGHHDPHGSNMGQTLDQARKAGITIRRTPGAGGVYSATLPAGSEFTADHITTSAIDAIGRATRPFLIRASYLQPHRPAVLPEPWASRYADVDFEIDTTEHGVGPTFEAQFGRVNRGAELDRKQLQEALRMYYGATAWVDDQVSQLVGALKRSGLLDSTVILFTSDHGAHVGEGGAFGKHTFAPESHRVPLIIAAPGGAAGMRRSDLATSEDVAATVLGAVGAARPASMTGRDLFADDAPPAIRSVIGYGETWSRAFPNRDSGGWIDGRGWPQRTCIRTERYRLDANTRIDGAWIEPLDADADLFLADNLPDPTERRNLATDPRYASVRDTMISELRSALADLHAAPRLEARPPIATEFQGA